MNTILAWSPNETRTNLAPLPSKYYIPNSFLTVLTFEQNLVHVWISITLYYSKNVSIIDLFIMKFENNRRFLKFISTPHDQEWIQNFRYILRSLSYLIYSLLFLFNPSMTMYLSIKFRENVSFPFSFLPFKMKVAFVQICLILKRSSCLSFFIHNGNNHIFQKCFQR